MERRKRRGGRVMPPWRRTDRPRFSASRNSDIHEPASRTSTAHSAPSANLDNAQNDNFSDTSSGLQLRNTGRHNTTFRKVKAIFERPDARVEENLRSTKRRIIQLRRQPDDAPVVCSIGFRSRTGWEPIRAVRENQDCIVALLPWGPNAQFALFAALDGHGRAGHQCSIFIAERVIHYLSRSLAARTVDVAYALHRAIDYAEKRLESPTVNIDCTVSGSTGVFVLIHGAKLYCANVGDSRALLGRELDPGTSYDFIREDKQRANAAFAPPSISSNRTVDDSIMSRGYRPVPLSFDHKPSRTDEKDRVVSAGARVEAWEGVDVGEERVWLPDARTPGLAVTRSFGDFIVKEFGVCATPEIYSLALCEEDRFLVLASDGVFEFLANYEVVSIVSRMRDHGTPQQAAEEIVRLAADRWIEDDSVIDDISCLVVFIDVKRPASDCPCEPRLVDTEISSAYSSSASPRSSSIQGYIPGTNSSLFGEFTSTHNPSHANAGSKTDVSPVDEIASEKHGNVIKPNGTVKVDSGVKQGSSNNADCLSNGERHHLTSIDAPADDKYADGDGSSGEPDRYADANRFDDDGRFEDAEENGDTTTETGNQTYGDGLGGVNSFVDADPESNNTFEGRDKANSRGELDEFEDLVIVNKGSNEDHRGSRNSAPFEGATIESQKTAAPLQVESTCRRQRRGGVVGKKNLRIGSDFGTRKNGTDEERTANSNSGRLRRLRGSKGRGDSALGLDGAFII